MSTTIFAKDLTTSDLPLAYVPTNYDDLSRIGDANLHQLKLSHRRAELRLERQLANPKFKTDGGEEDMLRLIRKKITILHELRNQARRTPTFSAFRPKDYYKMGDPVACYVGEWPYLNPDKVAKGNWLAGEVLLPSYEVEVCAVRFYKPLHNDQEMMGGKGFHFDIKDPRVLHRWEYDMFMSEAGDYDDFLLLWADHTAPSLPMPAGMFEYLANIIKEDELKA